MDEIVFFGVGGRRKMRHGEFGRVGSEVLSGDEEVGVEQKRV